MAMTLLSERMAEGKKEWHVTGHALKSPVGSCH